MQLVPSTPMPAMSDPETRAACQRLADGVHEGDVPVTGALLRPARGGDARCVLGLTPKPRHLPVRVEHAGPEALRAGIDAQDVARPWRRALRPTAPATRPAASGPRRTCARPGAAHTCGGSSGRP